QADRNCRERPPLLVLRRHQPSSKSTTGERECLPRTTHWFSPARPGHALLRPSGARCWRISGKHLARPRLREHVFWAVPLRRHHQKRAPVRSPKRARGAPAVKLDRLEPLAALANAYAALVRNVPVPDRALGVEANAAGHAVTEFGPYAP